jgi:hypothetical protein
MNSSILPLILGYTNPSIGFVANRGSFRYNDAVNLTGAALNPMKTPMCFRLIASTPLELQRR